MTAADLKAEIESGPLAAALAPFWADVFPAEPEPDPADAPAHARWSRISYRFGMLTPDACFGLLAVLHDGTRRSKPFPIAVGSFATFLAGRGLLRKIKAAVADANYPGQVRDICDLVATVTLAAPERPGGPDRPGDGRHGRGPRRRRHCDGGRRRGPRGVLLAALLPPRRTRVGC
ncbi:MAG: hypothetical protein U0804_28690 [Gemmataceae bacterium]